MTTSSESSTGRSSIISRVIGMVKGIGSSTSKNTILGATMFQVLVPTFGINRAVGEASTPTTDASSLAQDESSSSEMNGTGEVGSTEAQPDTTTVDVTEDSSAPAPVGIVDTSTGEATQEPEPVAGDSSGDTTQDESSQGDT